jgi:hypothetical protein
VQAQPRRAGGRAGAGAKAADRDGGDMMKWRRRGTLYAGCAGSSTGAPHNWLGEAMATTWPRLLTPRRRRGPVRPLGTYGPTRGGRAGTLPGASRRARRTSARRQGYPLSAPSALRWHFPPDQRPIGAPGKVAPPQRPPIPSMPRLARINSCGGVRTAVAGGLES